jgi:hypothetical protein
MEQTNHTKAAAPLSRNRTAAREQDEAAGGPQFRKMRIKTGEVVTVSLSLSVSSGSAHGVLRFKHERVTFRQPLGMIKKLPTKLEMLTDGWKRVREQKIIEKNGWSWVVPLP